MMAQWLFSFTNSREVVSMGRDGDVGGSSGGLGVVVAV